MGVEQLPNLFYASPASGSGLFDYRAIVYADISGLNLGTLTSLGLSAPSFFTVTNSPVTGAGTISLSMATQSGYYVLAAPTGAGGTPSFRPLTSVDISDYAQSISGSAVTSVGLSLPSIITVSNSPVTGVGTLTGTLATQNANKVWAGPTTGADAAPTFRSLVAADLGSVTGTVTSVAISVPSILSVAGSPITGSGSLDVTLANANASTFLAGPPTGAATTPTFRAIGSGDVSTFAELLANKNQPNGYAGLDANGQLVGTFIGRYDTQANINAIIPSTGELVTTSDTKELRVGDSTTSGGISLGWNGSNSMLISSISNSGVNGTVLRNAYTRATGLTPNGAPIDALNSYTIYLAPGIYDIRDTGPFRLSTSYIDIVGSDKDKVFILSNTSGHFYIDADNILLKNLTILAPLSTDTTQTILDFNAGAGTGLYSPTNTGVRITDCNFYLGPYPYAAVGATSNHFQFNSAMFLTGLGGTYTRINTNVGFFGCNLGSRFSGVSATFEDIVVGGTLAPGTTRSFGSSSAGITLFTGTLRRCRTTIGSSINLNCSGALVEYCSLRSNLSNTDMFRVASGVVSKFYNNRIVTNGTGKPIGDGGLSGLTAKIAWNYYKNAIGTGIVNAADNGYSGYNIVDSSFTSL